MRFSWLCFVPSVLALAIEKREADFYTVRTKMNKDMSGRGGDPNGKYFRKQNMSRAHIEHHFEEFEFC